MKKIVIVALVVSIILLNVILIINNSSFLALYYLLWVLLVGKLLWMYRLPVETYLVSLKYGDFKKFLLLGLFMVLCEEIIAGTSINLGIADSLGDILLGIRQFIAFNILALPGFIIAWYILLKHYIYTRPEVFILSGLFGILSEKLFRHTEHPIMIALLILPTMFTYAIIIAPSVMSFRGLGAKPKSKFIRYVLGIFFPFVVSIPFVLLVMYLRARYPEAFPPAGFVG